MDIKTRSLTAMLLGGLLTTPALGSPTNSQPLLDTIVGDGTAWQDTSECSTEYTLAKRLRFAGLPLSRSMLRLPDRWVRQLSDFDRAARTRIADTGSREFLEFASSHAVGWTDGERAQWRELVKSLGAAAQGFSVKIPRMFLVRTTGEEELEASGYTRARSIVLSENAVSPDTNPRAAFFLLAHELFHVLSRFNPQQRNELYGLLGFRHFTGFEYPAELEETRLSNPDAFLYRHALTVQTPDGPADVVPVNQSGVPLEELLEGLNDGSIGSVFEVLNILLLPVDTTTGRVRRGDGGSLISYHFGNTDWVPQMLRNSSFIIHPEEVLADNFATLMEARATGKLEETNPAGFPINDEALLLAIEAILTAGCAQ